MKYTERMKEKVFVSSVLKIWPWCSVTYLGEKLSTVPMVLVSPARLPKFERKVWVCSLGKSFVRDPANDHSSSEETDSKMH